MEVRNGVQYVTHMSYSPFPPIRQAQLQQQHSFDPITIIAALHYLADPLSLFLTRLLASCCSLRSSSRLSILSTQLHLDSSRRFAVRCV